MEDFSAFSDEQLKHKVWAMLKLREARAKQIQEAIDDHTIVSQFYLLKYESNESLAFADVLAEIEVRNARKRERNGMG